MTPDEVRTELAKIILPAAIDWIRENPYNDLKKEKKTRKGSSPPPPKDPDEPDNFDKGDDEEPKDKGPGKKK
jgi:hypothetical protein